MPIRRFAQRLEAAAALAKNSERLEKMLFVKTRPCYPLPFSANDADGDQYEISDPVEQSFAPPP
jgi:hypothetical protein